LNKLRTIALGAAVTVAAGAAASADNSNTYYALSAPRVIVVPQPGDEARHTQASLRAPDGDDDQEVAAPQRPRRVDKAAPARAKPQAKKVDPRERRRPFNVSLPAPPAPPEPEPEAEPTGPKRALLSAPPPPPMPSLHDGPTPLKPTPRFGQPLPEQPPALTTFTPPPMPAPAARPVAAAPPTPEPAPAPALDDNDDHLPPPGDPRLAPPEPKD